MGHNIMERAKVFGVVLAGGKSSRMGRDKVTLRYNGQMLICRMLLLLEELSRTIKLQDILVSGTLAGGSVDGYESIPDCLPNLGPLGGIYSILKHVQGQPEAFPAWLVVVPVDMPHLTSASLEELLLQATGDVVLVHFEGKELPLVLRLDEAMFDVLSHTVHDEGDRHSLSLRALFERAQQQSKGTIMSVPISNNSIMSNFNTPEDLQQRGRGEIQ